MAQTAQTTVKLETGQDRIHIFFYILKYSLFQNMKIHQNHSIIFFKKNCAFWKIGIYVIFCFYVAREMLLFQSAPELHWPRDTL